MQITLLKSKIHRATVTDVHLEYEGSLTIDKDLMTIAGIMEHEQIQVVNLNNGARFITYAITGAKGQIVVNGAAARLALTADLIIIMAFGSYDEKESKTQRAKIIRVNELNQPVL